MSIYKKNGKIRVLMAAAEVAPFVKVGGLGDVTGSLPVALKKIGIDARVIMPLYGSIDRKKFKLKKIYSGLEVPSGRLLIKINVWQAKIPGTAVIAYFIDAPEYFEYKDVYVPGDNSERFLFFSLAALYALPVLDFEPQIIHCHDSHVALIPDIIAVSNLEYLKNLKTLYTIHNFSYQGKTKPATLSVGNLNRQSTKCLSIDARDGDINFMVQGVLMADLVNTVAPTYAREITTSYYGASLENIIRRRKEDLYGILNGIDFKFFDPARDKYVKQKFSARSLDKKTANKLYLQKKLGLPVAKDIPLAGMVTRLAWQKGIELFTERFARLDCQYVFLGTGEEKYEKHLAALARKYPDRISANITFDIGLAQEIYAASDIFLMPSRYEPCGLGQMIAMRYGALPVARKTGGIADTVTPEVGFTFKNVDEDEFFAALKKALKAYRDEPKRWRQMQTRAMKKDFSWNKSAKEYVKLYEKLIK
ncbi:MAG: glycogen/starch synthase [Candidatus Falkowbacteria bacterium]